jgi:hypothetical protein
LLLDDELAAADERDDAAEDEPAELDEDDEDDERDDEPDEAEDEDRDDADDDGLLLE